MNIEIDIDNLKNAQKELNEEIETLNKYVGRLENLIDFYCDSHTWDGPSRVNFSKISSDYKTDLRKMVNKIAVSSTFLDAYINNYEKLNSEYIRG